MRPDETVIDTNVVLDAWLFGDSSVRALTDALAAGHLQWCCTPAMAAELAHVLTRPLPVRWEAARVQALAIDFSTLQAACPEAPAAPGHALVCSDGDDQKFIDLAIARRCRWLFTRDRALLRLARAAAYHGVTVLRPADWRMGLPADQASRPADYQAAGSFLRSSNSLSDRCTM